jgi:hypothetical protein
MSKNSITSRRNSPYNVGLVNELWDKKFKIPDVQREDTAWSLDQKQLLIDSIYNNYDVPKFYFRRDYEGADEIWWMLDGQQRLTAIKDFINNVFPLGDYTTLPEEIRNKYYKDLGIEDLKKIKNYDLDFIIIDCNVDVEEDLFLRLNKSTPLNAAEKRNGIRGELRDFVRDNSDHKFFKKVAFPSRRFAHHAVCAQLVLLILKQKATDLKGKQLTNLYKDNTKFSQKAKVQKDLNAILNQMDKIFTNKEPYMKKYNVLSIFLFLLHLKHNYSTTEIKNSEYLSFIDDFEKERLKNNTRSEDDSGFDPRLQKYSHTCSNSPDSLDHMAFRQKVLMEQFLSKYVDLPTKDAIRFFTPEMKICIYLLNNKKCQSKRDDCPVKGEVLEITDCEFDHITEHTSGGKTKVSNGQTMCCICHQEKTAASNRKKR